MPAIKGLPRRESKETPPLVLKAQELALKFEYKTDDLLRGVTEFLKEMDDGLATKTSVLPQIPTYVTAVPQGDEKGLYLAVDLGGTNFRVCSVYLNGDGTFTLRQSKTKIPQEFMSNSSYKPLFKFMAEQIDTFIYEHLSEHWSSHLEKKRKGREKFVDEEYFDLGFTFSFPVAQTAINKGTLIRWTKGFDIPDAVGQDVCDMLQHALDERHLPVRVAALINDTVGTLMARAYTSRAGDKSLMGAIFGTGTNGCYVERVSKIKKLEETSSKSTGDMVINCEWGSFDNPLKVLPNTKWDAALNDDTVNKNFHMFEKRVSGMYLGEILRRVMLEMTQDKDTPLFSQSAIPKDSALYRIWAIDTSFLSLCETDDSIELKSIANHLIHTLGIDSPTFEDCEAVQILSKAIGLRAARLSAVAISSVIIWSGRLKEHTAIDVGVDGSLVEFYPNFEEMIRFTMHEIPELGATGEKKITIGVAKDGSGVGAALGALVATKGRR